MLKGYKNKEISSDSSKKSDKKVKKIFSFKGNPPVSIEADSRVEAEKKFKNLNK